MIKTFRSLVILIISGVLSSTILPAYGQEASSSATVHLVFNETSLVRAKTYTLADIARIETADQQQQLRLGCLVMGNSPVMGYRMTLMPQVLLMELKRRGLAEPEVGFQFPKMMVLEREVQPVDLKALEEAIRKEVLDQVDSPGEAVVVEKIQLPQSITLPAGELSQQVETRLPRRGVGSGSFSVDLLVDGESQRKISGSFFLDKYVEALAVERAITRGQEASAEACKVIKRRLSQLPNQPLTPMDLESGTALTARRNLMPGDVLSWLDVERQVLVRRGQTVQMLLESAKGMRITATGQARANGALGDPIEVVNAASGKIVRGVVAGEQMVKVIF